MDLREYNFSVIQCLCNSKVDVMNFLQLAGTGIRDEISRNIVKLRQGSGKDRQGMAPKVKGLKA